MKAPSVSILYVHFRKRVSVYKGQPIRLGQIAQIICEPEHKQALDKLPLTQPNELDGNLLLIDMMTVVRNVKRLYPRMLFEQYGEPHVLVEVISDRRISSLPFIIGVWLLLFIGSGLAIMNFHADVSMLQVHRRIYELVTGEQIQHPYILQIPYSIGIGIGMVLFFNHLFKKKFNEEPSPLEVEMFLYQENLNHYVIHEEYTKMHSHKDVGAHDRDS